MGRKDIGEVKRIKRMPSATAKVAGLIPAAAGGEKSSLQDSADGHTMAWAAVSRFKRTGKHRIMDLVEFVAEIVAVLRAICAWLGLVEKPAEPSPPDPTAEHRPDGRAVPMLIVDDRKPPLPPPERFSGVE